MTRSSMRIIRLLALAVLAIGLVGCAGDPQTELDVAGDADTQAALWTGDFQRSCGYVWITDEVFLDADCGRRNGSSGWARLDLNMGIANQNGQLVWRRGGGYGGSCRDCRVPANTIWGWDDVTMSCLCRNQRGREDYSSLNLAEQISNQDGVLDFDFF